jgi:hypothetical protein
MGTLFAIDGLPGAATDCLARQPDQSSSSTAFIMQAA